MLQDCGGDPAAAAAAAEAGMGGPMRPGVPHAEATAAPPSVEQPLPLPLAASAATPAAASDGNGQAVASAMAMAQDQLAQAARPLPPLSGPRPAPDSRQVEPTTTP